MHKISEIVRIFDKYNSEYRKVENDYQSVLKSISDYIQSVPSFKEIIKPSFEERRNELYFREFNITVTIEDSIKLCELYDSLHYSKQIVFYFEKDRSNKEEIYKVFISDDGFIVEDIYGQGSICDTHNSYKGKLILEKLLIKLVENKVISV
ncbi:MAG: hypothetical protein WAK61_08675 [Leclercia sp.]